jgi:hypothetical protein
MEQLPHRKYPENAHVRFLRLHKPKSGCFIFFYSRKGPGFDHTCNPAGRVLKSAQDKSGENFTRRIKFKCPM